MMRSLQKELNWITFTTTQLLGYLHHNQLRVKEKLIATTMNSENQCLKVEDSIMIRLIAKMTFLWHQMMRLIS
mgnify:CR=1 FL=1